MYFLVLDKDIDIDIELLGLQQQKGGDLVSSGFVRLVEPTSTGGSLHKPYMPSLQPCARN